VSTNSEGPELGEEVSGGEKPSKDNGWKRLDLKEEKILRSIITTGVSGRMRKNTLISYIKNPMFGRLNDCPVSVWGQGRGKNTRYLKGCGNAKMEH